MALTLDDINRNPGSRDPIPGPIEVEAIGPYALRITFDDGLVRELDLEEYVFAFDAAIMLPLRDPDYFARVQISEDMDTTAWPNGLDICPDILHGEFDPGSGPPLRLIREYVREEARHFKYDKPLVWAIRRWLSGWSWALRWRLREFRQRRVA